MSRDLEAELQHALDRVATLEAALEIMGEVSQRGLDRYDELAKAIDRELEHLAKDGVTDKTVRTLEVLIRLQMEAQAIYGL